MNQKQTGSYYTPQLLADYMVYRLFKEGKYSFGNEINVLEPSVGDGIFLKSLLDGNYFKDQKKKLKASDIPKLNIDAVEIDKEVAKKAQEKYGQVAVTHKDYLKYFLSSHKKYDLIIGNPPYVRRRNMSDETKDLCAKVHELTGLRDKKPKNLWTSFLMAAKASLKKKGVLAFVLPTDLLQVKYAEEIRKIMYEEFDSVEIFSLNWVYFDDIEQDVVILICSNGHKTNSGIDFYHINSLEELGKPKATPDHDNSQRQTLSKWTNYALSRDEFKLLDDIYQKINPRPIEHYCESGAGIVTAANDYYIVDQATVDRYHLEDIRKYTIKKSSSMFAAVRITNDDIEKKNSEGKEVNFLDFPNKPKGDLPKNYQEYLKYCENNGIHERYKMRLRENWYAVPSVWSSEAFFTKRSNLNPRIIANDANVYVTDAFYRISMKDGFGMNNLVFSFYNTFSFIYAELEGRYYGGGVLELTPNEFKRLPVPYINGSISTKLHRLDRMVRSGCRLSEILDYTDETILHNHYGLSRDELVQLRSIYEKLLVRRLKQPGFEL